MMSETRAQERFSILCVKAVDDLLDAQEKEEFNHFLEESMDLRQEYEAMKKIKAITREMEFRTPSDSVWDHYWTGVYNRIERGIGWLLFSFGAIILMTWGAFKLVESVFMDDHLTGVVKLGILLLTLGLSILIVSVVRERCFMSKRDPYREIIR
jgi:hypothetical protein